MLKLPGSILEKERSTSAIILVIIIITLIHVKFIDLEII